MSQRWKFVLGLALALTLLGPPPTFSAQAPQLPQVRLDTTYTAPTGQQTSVPAGGDLQSALNAAQPGDAIILQAGATYSGNFTLPTKSGSVRRAIMLNSARTAVVDSYVSDLHEAGADSQALAGWNGPGPFKIVNNYLEGAGENVMFGGVDPSITNLVPSDIEIRQNYIFKQPSWRGASWSVKNLLELKNAQRVLIDGNLLENNWANAQNGFGVLFTVRNQAGTAPWSTVRDVTFRNTIVRTTGPAGK